MPASEIPPFYLPSGAEIELFEAALEDHIPVMLIGPTGCGKTRLVEHMAVRMGRQLNVVIGNEDTTTADLLGRYLVRGGDVEWHDGPVTTAVRAGKLCFVDEVAEVRREALAALHSLSDHRRRLHLDRLSTTLEAADNFGLVCAYNPTRAVGFRELRPAFRQRFATIALTYLAAEEESAVVASEAGVAASEADELVRLATVIRDAVGDQGELPSTRSVVHAARLVRRDIPRAAAVETCIMGPIAEAHGERAVTALRDLVAVA